MELLHNKAAGLVMLLGSILFIIAAFLPYSRIFAESDPAVRMEIISQQAKMWRTGQVLFVLGSVITVLGLVFLYYKFRTSIHSSLAWLSILFLLAGSILWSWHCVERMISPEGFVNGTLTPKLFLLYSILTQAGLIIFGVLLLGTNLAGWMAWMLILGTVLISILMIIFKDMPPFVYYVFTLILAIKLLAESGNVSSI